MVTLEFLDWVVIAVFLIITMGIGLYFTKRAGKNMETYFTSGRSLPWYIAGISIVATNFASDTPLWVTSLVRQYGIYAVWQYWAQVIGAALCVVYFARMWRRMNIITDIEFLEIRYSGKSAAVLRFWSGFYGALFFCPLTISWVTKAMETIARETMGIPPEYQTITTAIVLLIALITCVFSGLTGVVYSDLIQLIVAWAGTFLLAFLSVKAVGGLPAMVDKISNLQSWSGTDLSISPKIGPSSQGMMSIWNIFGYFGFFWVGTAVSGGYAAQRLLACKNSKHATYAQLLNTYVYWGLLAWPWILVALCSLILIPNLGAGVSHDSAYPRMIMKILPVGIRGMLVAALLAAFISTINTIFNWGSSYFVNDIYKRFFVKDAKDKHYVSAARVTTVCLAVFGGGMSLLADDIQQLIQINIIMGSGTAVILILRFFWSRMTAAGELAASVVGMIMAPLMFFGVFNGLAAKIFMFGPEVDFINDFDYLGAKSLFMLVPTTLAAVIGSLVFPKTAPENLINFVMTARPPRFFWRSVIKENNLDYDEPQNVSRTLVSWFFALLGAVALLFGLGKLLFGVYTEAAVWAIVFIVSIAITIKRAQQDFKDEKL